MRLARYEHAGRELSGVVLGDDGDERVHALPGGASVLDLVGAGLPAARDAAALAAQGPGTSVADVRLLPPVVAPSVRDFVAFEEHVEGMVRGGSPDAVVGEAWYEAPTFYFTNPHGLVGAHDDVPVPPGSAQLDFELEVACVVGRAGRDLSLGQAREAVFGYTLFNDWSARDLQRREMAVGLGPCKGKDSATTLGPWLVTADELEHLRDDDGYLALELVAQVNGVEVGRDLLSNASWTFEEMLVYASRGTWVRPGDVLGSGTCGGGGCLAELWGRRGRQDPPPLVPGDVVRLAAEGLGSVENRVVAGPSLADLPAVGPARRRSRARHRTP